MKTNPIYNKIYIQQQQQYRVLTTQDCVLKLLDYPERVDIERNIQEGMSTIKVSKCSQFSYSVQNGIQALRGITLKHAHLCAPLSNTHQNSQKPLRLCSCVMLKSGQEFLITQRSPFISFPNAWVLPGGTLQKDEGVFEGGIRQCQEQVGFKTLKTDLVKKHFKNHEIMLWQSYYVKDNTIRSGNLVFFFNIETEPFEVKIQQEEVSNFKWRKTDIIHQDQIVYSNQNPVGYGLGHLSYINHYRNKTHI